MHAIRRMIVVGAVLLAAGVAGSLALGAATDHGKPAPTKSAAPAPQATPKPEATAEGSGAHSKKTDASTHESNKPEPSKSEASKSEPATSAVSSSLTEGVPTTAQGALEALKAGNARWVSGKATSPNTGAERRADTAANGQKPFVTIYTCADSRLPVERIFDCGVGDVFVLRLAGNVIGEHSAGTIEYGVDHLHTPLLVVMGHTKCGAVGAACAGGHAGGNVDSLLAEIAPAVERAKKVHPEATDAQLVEFAVRENVWQSIFDLLRTSEGVRGMVVEGKVTVVGAVCDISTGKVDFLGEHPWQSQLLQALAPTASGESKAAEVVPAPAHEASANDEHH
jgi:carbonic anhydrase